MPLVRFGEIELSRRFQMDASHGIPPLPPCNSIYCLVRGWLKYLYSTYQWRNNAQWIILQHTHIQSLSLTTPFMSNSLSGCVLSARLGENFPIWFTIPRKRRTSPTFVGTLTFWMAMTFLGSGLIPVPSMQCPKNFTDFCANQHFSEFSVTPASCSRWSTFSSLSSCSSCVLQSQVC